jgi:uncharacterized membrane protein YraQ (UPF0718 family)
MKDTLIFIVEFALKAFVRALPLIVITVPLSLWLKKSALVAKWIPGIKSRPFAAIFIATAAGAFSPLCSCSVIPVIAGFLRMGTPLGPVMAFWLASPSMDPEVFALSTAYLGLPLAIGRLVATGVASIAAGFAAHWLETSGAFGKDYLRGAASAKFTPLAKPRGSLTLAASSSAAGTAKDKDCGCAPAPASNPGIRDKLASLLRESAPEILKLTGIMLLAFVVEGAVIRFVPVDALTPLFGKKSLFAVPIAAAVGVPMYVTNIAALGFVSGLISKGMSEGAALAFLIGGAATTLPAMTAVWSLAKPRVFALYIGSIIAAALASGWIWNLLR